MGEKFFCVRCKETVTLDTFTRKRKGSRIRLKGKCPQCGKPVMTYRSAAKKKIRMEVLVRRWLYIKIGEK